MKKEKSKQNSIVDKEVYKPLTDFIMNINYNNCRYVSSKMLYAKKVFEYVEKLKEEIEDAQEDCGNLDWISKDQALMIINKRMGEFK